MSAAEDGGDLFLHDIYERSFVDTKTLKSRLPEAAVASLAREVLSRLPEQFGAGSQALPNITPDMVEELAHALIADDSKIAARLVSTQEDAGHSGKSLYLAYLAEAARLLGVWWEKDIVGFAQVTTGTARIYAILRGLRPLLLGRGAVLTGKQVMMCCVPGETHTLGIRMATDLLRADGWTVDLNASATHEALIERINEAKPALIGMSAAGQHAVVNLAKLVMAVRICAPETPIIVGGNIVEVAKDMVDLTGVDAQAVTFEEARDALDALWAQRTSAT